MRTPFVWPGWFRRQRRVARASALVCVCVTLSCVLGAPRPSVAQETRAAKEAELRKCQALVEAAHQVLMDDLTLFQKLGTATLEGPVDTKGATHVWIPSTDAAAAFELPREDLSAFITESVLEGKLEPDQIPDYVRKVQEATRMKLEALRTQLLKLVFVIELRRQDCEDLRRTLGCIVRPPQPDEVIAAANCPIPEPDAPLTGTWRIQGTPVNTFRQSMKGTVVLAPVDQATGQQLAAQNWGVNVSKACTGAGAPASPFFYKGTITWDAGSFFDQSFLFFTDAPSTILLCTSSKDSSAGRGNFRDSHDFHGAFLQWNGVSGGEIVPEPGEGAPSQIFTAVKQP